MYQPVVYTHTDNNADRPVTFENGENFAMTYKNHHSDRQEEKTYKFGDMEHSESNGTSQKLGIHSTKTADETAVQVQIPDDSWTEEDGRCIRCVILTEDKVETFLKRYKSWIIFAVKLTLLLLYLAYYIKCMIYRFGDKGSIELTVLTALILFKIAYDQLKRVGAGSYLSACFRRTGTVSKAAKHRKIIRYLLYLAAATFVVLYLAFEVMANSWRNAQALSGVACLIFGCYVFSTKPSKVNWHPVFWGFLLQFLLAVLTLRTEPGYQFFKWIGDVVHEFVMLSDAGSNFVLGASFRATSPGFFFETAGMIVFFDAIIFVLDYLGVLEAVILTFGRALAFCLNTGPVESVVAAANIFIGLSEAPVMVRPYLPAITKSELHAIMTCGFSSISGAFMAMFIRAGAPPTHLLTACLISAPAALAISKLLYPEVEEVDFNKQRNVRTRDESSPKTCMQAVADGATFAITLIATIMVNMMAFVSILALVDAVIVWIGARAGWTELTFNFISSYAFYPISWMMGISSQDCMKAGHLQGLKLLATPFVAYKDLGALIDNRNVFENYLQSGNATWHYSGDDIILDATNATLKEGILEARTEAILTYAMCGLSAFPAIGFSMGTLIPMSPMRKDDVISMVVRAFVAGNLANFATGAIAGVMFDGQ